MWPKVLKPKTEITQNDLKNSEYFVIFMENINTEQKQNLFNMFTDASMMFMEESNMF